MGDRDADRGSRISGKYAARGVPRVDRNCGRNPRIQEGSGKREGGIGSHKTSGQSSGMVATTQTQQESFGKAENC